MGKRVLVVDDEPDILDLMTIWLQDDPRCGAVDRAATLGEALAAVERHLPDAILLDFHVAGLTSASVLTRLRAACPLARILVHTADRAAAASASVLELGADAILEKSGRSVADVVEAVLG